MFLFGRNPDKLSAVLNKYGAAKGTFVYDIEKGDKTSEYADYLLRNKIQTVISTVGVGRGGKLQDLDPKDLFEMTRANFIVPSLILKSSVEPLERIGGGRVILFGSIVSVRPQEGSSGYSGTKAALKGLIDSARNELRDFCPAVSIHGIYSTTFDYVGYDTILNSILYLMGTKFGINIDVVIGLM